MIMTIFEGHLDLHGSDIARWPAADRDTAMALLAVSVEARASLQAMRDVEAVLTATRATVFGFDRIADIASRQRQVRPIAAATRRAGWAAAAMIMLVMGLAVGDIRPAHDDGNDTYLAASLEAGGTTDVE